MGRRKGSKNKPKPILEAKKVSEAGPDESFTGTGTHDLGFLEIKVGVHLKYPNSTKPKKQTDHSACYDLHAYLKKNHVVTIYDAANKKHDIVLRSDGVTIAPGERALIPTGLHFDIPAGFSLRVHPRSGLAVKQGLTLINSEGVIDSDYVDQVFITLVNFSKVPASIKHDERLAQLELFAEVESSLVEVDMPQARGNRTGGFGSTGV